MSTEKLKELRVEHKENLELAYKIDLLLLQRIGQEALEIFWKEKNLIP